MESIIVKKVPTASGMYVTVAEAELTYPDTSTNSIAGDEPLHISIIDDGASKTFLLTSDSIFSNLNNPAINKLAEFESLDEAPESEGDEETENIREAFTVLLRVIKATDW